MAQPVNPYVAGPPLTGETGFFGRQEIVAQVIRELRNPGTNVLVIHGQRRIGKTSLLHQLHRQMPRDAFWPYYFDLQGHEHTPLPELLHDLADDIAFELNLPLPEPWDWEHGERTFVRRFIPWLLENLPEGVRPVILFDEFDVLEIRVENGVEQLTPETHPLLTFIRRDLLNREQRLAFVFVIGRSPRDLSLDVQAVFKSSLKIELWTLSREEMERLVRQAEENGSLRFTDSAINRIWELTGGHPFLTQLLCQRIWQRARRGQPAEAPLIGTQDVEAAAEEAIEMGDNPLDWWWKGLTAAERIYIAALAQTADEGEGISEDKVIDVLSQHARRLRSRAVENAPEDLVKRRVLETVSQREGTYRFSIELLRRWVQKNHPLEQVKDDLDRENKEADLLYQAAERYFNREKYDKALENADGALAENPQHLRALLLKGESQLALEQTKDAIETLRQAYEMDRDRARLPLARALLQRAGEFFEAGQVENLSNAEREDQEDRALKTCAEILELSPRERAARELQRDIWFARGDRALDDEDFEEARRCYGQVAEDFPQDAKEKIDKANEKQALKAESEERFQKGRAALLRGAWDEAIENLRWVVNQNPRYTLEDEYAVDLLARAVHGEETPPPPWQLWLLRNWKGVSLALLLALVAFAASMGGRIVTLGTHGYGPLASLATPTPTPTPTFTPTPTSTFTLTPTPTLTPTSTNTPTPTMTPTLTPTPTPKAGDTWMRPQDEMVMAYIPAGCFQMGSENGDGDEQPVHEVCLDAFWMDAHEVTNAMYARCMQAAACDNAGESYLDDPDYADHPVVYVTWYDAREYCEWAGARLPTETEWEYAARGGLEGKKYPWGDDYPTCTPGARNGAQYDTCNGRTVPVMTFSPNGYGLYDMAGNVWEWVADWYDSGYYRNSPSSNPQGPQTGEHRVLRGGSWSSNGIDLRVSNRNKNYPPFSRLNFGFRCVRSP